MTKKIFLVALTMILCGVFSAMALENLGAAKISLDGGTRGAVPFPHHRHQTVLKDCKACHDLFPQEQGGIMRLKKEGKLVKQQVMKQHCIKCHRTMKKEGANTGPTTCSRCHVKKKK